MTDESQKEAEPQASSAPHSTHSETFLPSGRAAARESHDPAPPQLVTIPKILLASVIVAVSGILVSVHFQSFLEDQKFRGMLVSAGMHRQLQSLVSRPDGDAAGVAIIPLVPIVGKGVAAALAAWLAGSLFLALVSWTSWRRMLWRWALRFLWLWLFGFFQGMWDATGTFATAEREPWYVALSALLPLVHALAWGGWLAGAIGLAVDPRGDRAARILNHPAWVWVAAIAYTVTFATLSILQYQAMMVPHGDSAMYEEHLWNLLHGKGFRSQLDGGRLFFGEHLEVIHVLLLPIYLLFPHLITLNICLCLGLASGSIAVRGLSRRLTGSDAAANWLGISYLLYFPLQYLNLEVSLKTFRPENFGVPLLLFAIWALEARRYRTMLALLMLTLLCKEDYAIPVSMLGLFLAARGHAAGGGRRVRWLGLSIFAASALFLAFVLTVFIPAFRESPPHYMAYYPELGRTPGEVVANVVRNPGILMEPIVNGGNMAFLISLIAPLALLPVFGASRIWLCLPTLASILLIQLSDARSPFFHFHAPLVPIVFWSAAEGVARVSNLLAWRHRRGSNHASAAQIDRSRTAACARLAAMCALVTGFFLGKSPLAVAFYDPDAGLRGYWRVLYAPQGIIELQLRNFQQRFPVLTEQDVMHLIHIGRARSFDRLLPLIPRDSAVAATDFARTRFTHHRECHQYGEGGLKPHVDPRKIDYIVIDRFGPYSDWLANQRLREQQEQPDRWEVMHWDKGGELFFFVLRAKRSGSP